MFQASRTGALARPILPRLVPALLACAATLLAGAAPIPFAGVAGWLESSALLPILGVVLAAAAGLLACHLALMTIAPRLSPWAGALPAALIASSELPKLIAHRLAPGQCQQNCWIRWEIGYASLEANTGQLRVGHGESAGLMPSLRATLRRLMAAPI